MRIFRRKAEPRWKAWGEVVNGKTETIYAYAPAFFRTENEARDWASDWMRDNRWGGGDRYPRVRVQDQPGKNEG